MKRISDLTQNEIFEFKGIMWKVTGASLKNIHIQSDEGYVSAVPLDCDIMVRVAA